MKTYSKTYFACILVSAIVVDPEVKNVLILQQKHQSQKSEARIYAVGAYQV